MDDVSDLADRSDAFANFLTVLRKFVITCVYVFYTIYPNRQNRRMILAQTKIFIIFYGSIQAPSIVRILTSFCSRYKYNYIRSRDFWINRRYFDISNSTEKQCLTFDTQDVNHLGPTKFRNRADSNQKQICYYNRNKRDTNFNCLLAVRKQTSSNSDTSFSITKLIDKKNKNKETYLEINKKLSDFNNDNCKQPIQVCRSNISRESDNNIQEK